MLEVDIYEKAFFAFDVRCDVNLLCGGILNVGSLLMYMPHPTGEALISTLLLGLPLDILHGASTVFFLYTCAPAMIEKIERIKHKFGIFKSS